MSAFGFLPDDALVIRGGVSSAKSIRSNAEQTRRKTGQWAISGAAGIGIDLDTLCAAYPMPQQSLRRTSAGALRDAGYDVALTGATGHCTIFFPLEPSQPQPPELVERLRDLLEPPEPNPAADQWQ